MKILFSLVLTLGVSGSAWAVEVDEFIRANNKKLGYPEDFLPSHVVIDDMSSCYDILNGTGQTPPLLGKGRELTKTATGAVLIEMDPTTSSKVTIYNESGMATVEGGSCTATAAAPKVYDLIAIRLATAMSFRSLSRDEIKRLKTLHANDPQALKKVQAQERAATVYWSNIADVLKRCADKSNPIESVRKAAEKALAEGGGPMTVLPEGSKTR